MAAAVHPELTYVLVRGSRWAALVDLARVAAAGHARGDRRSRGVGRELLGLTYRGPFDELPIQAGVEHRVIPWDEVSDEEGTGIVHIAPGCGQEDFALAKRDGLPVLDPIDEFGIFRDGFGWQTGRFAGATEDAAADLASDVAADLEDKGLSSAASATCTTIRSAGAAGPSSSSAWSTSGSSPWTRCGSRSAR